MYYLEITKIALAGCPEFYQWLRDALLYQIVCFFEHCSNRGGGQTHVQKFCCKFGIILEAIWQYELT